MLKRLKLLKLIPCDRVHFLMVKVPENVKLNKEIVKLNYGHLSPYKEFDIFYLIQDNTLYLWFIDTSNKRYLGNIPECALILLYIKNKPDGIYIFKTPRYCIVSVKKDEVIAEQLVVSCNEIESILNILRLKYSFSEEKMFYLKEISPSVLSVLSSYLKMNFDTFVENIKNKSNYVMFGLLIFIYTLVINNIILAFWFKQKTFYLQKKISSILEVARVPQKKFLFLERASILWKEILGIPSIANILTVYLDILRLLEELNLTVQEISFSSTHGKLIVLSSDPSFIDKISKLSYIANMQLISSSSFGKENRYFLSFEIDLRKFKCK